MPRELETCWTNVKRAAAGDPEACNALARDYLAVVRAYLRGWCRHGMASSEVEDAVQEVFLDLFRQQGALTRLDPSQATPFRSFLKGVAHNVARRYQSRRAKRSGRDDAEAPAPDDLASTAPSPSQVFDRAWAQCMIRRAASRQRALAARHGAEALQRIELLELRFRDGMPIRDIASRWDVDPAQLHREYSRARQEFRVALEAEVRFHRDSDGTVDARCRELIGLLA